MSQAGAPLQGAATPTACPPGDAGHPEPRGKEAYLPAFSRVARLQCHEGPRGDGGGGGGGRQALPLLLDEVVTEQPCLQDRDQKR